ncbi:hypothetical protein EPN18_05350 [bacterium]|nr:MAG: hypothetical protein EPN18_05350 [bacterium]
MKKLFTISGFAAVALLITHIHPIAVAATAEIAQVKTYRNFETGIVFDYPYNYVVSESLARNGSFVSVLVGEMKNNKARWLFTVELIDMNSFPKNMFDQKTVPFLQFATDVARYDCESSTPKSATYCPDVADIVEFTSANGVDGFELALNETREIFTGADSSTITNTVRSPVYVFDVSSNKSTRALLIEPNSWPLSEPRAMEVFKEIVKTFNVNPRAVKNKEKP